MILNEYENQTDQNHTRFSCCETWRGIISDGSYERGACRIQCVAQVRRAAAYCQWYRIDGACHTFGRASHVV